MARQQGTVVQNSFIQGLITEATALRFPENASTDTYNCIFDETGRVTRRPGIDLELGYELRTRTKGTGDVYTEFFWQAVAGQGDRSFVVQQQGSDLFFYDVSSSSVVSGNLVGSLDLLPFKPTGTSLNASQSICQFAQGRGKLLVVSRAIDPILVVYDAATNSFLGTAIDIRIRDFIGLDSGLDDNERTTSSVANLITNNPSHYYNLLNQSWFIADALTQWDTARADVPSNQDYVTLYRESETDAFDNAKVTGKTPGNRPAPKGHFILSAWCPDHTQAMADEGFTATISAEETQTSNTIISESFVGDLDDGSLMSVAFDGDTVHTEDNAPRKNSATTGWIGGETDFPLRVSSVIVYGTNDEGFVNSIDPTVTLTLYGKQGAEPANSTDGTSLGTAVFTDTNDESAGRTISSSDTETRWDWVWVKLDHNGAANNIFVGEIEIFTLSDQEGLFCTTERPSCVEFFAGRSWYAGLSFDRLASYIYFSQIIQKDDQYGKCYQQNDPASEDFTDLLQDDGGVIVIPEIAKIIRLFAYQSALLVFASNGVWMISGGSQDGFLATDFVVKRLSSEGTNSPLSFVNNKGIPAWWGDSGLFTISFDANYQSFTVISISDEKIKTFFAAVPDLNRQYVKGVFDQNNSVGYWLYNTDESLAEEDYFRYDAVLGINGLSGAFYPWVTTIKAERDGPEVRGAVYIINPLGLFTPTVKITTTIDNDPDEDLTYSEIYHTGFKDWIGYATDINDEDFIQDYESYAITGYRLDGQGNRFFQGNYITVFTEDNGEENSCFVQGIYDFTTSGNSGKWSTPQQCFNNNLTNRSVNHRRLKIRGRGLAMQLKFFSESGKPFTLIGWSLLESSNAAV